MVDRNLLRELDVPDLDGDEFDMDLLLGDSLGVDRRRYRPRQGRRGRRRPGRRRRRLQVRGARPALGVGGGRAASAAPATRSRSCWRAWTTTPARSSSRATRPAAIRAWDRFTSEHREGDVVTGKVTRKIKGGLLVDIGYNAFLPASQVDIRRAPDIADYLGREVRCLVLSIDENRRNIVLSRRTLIETERVALRERLLSEIAVGQVRTGTVKNLADFGAFVDLGGMDGLLHITDMSWERLKHPSERLQRRRPDRGHGPAMSTRSAARSPWA